MAHRLPAVTVEPAAQLVPVDRDLVEGDLSCEAVRLWLRLLLVATQGAGLLEATRGYGAELLWIWQELGLAGYLDETSATPGDPGLLLRPYGPGAPQAGTSAPTTSTARRGRVRLDPNEAFVLVPGWLVASEVSDAAVRYWALLALAADHGGEGCAADALQVEYDGRGLPSVVPPWLEEVANAATLLELLAAGACGQGRDGELVLHLRAIGAAS